MRNVNPEMHTVVKAAEPMATPTTTPVLRPELELSPCEPASIEFEGVASVEVLIPDAELDVELELQLYQAITV